MDRPDSLLHAWGDGEAVVGVEGREPAQPDNSNPQWTSLITAQCTYRMYIITPKDQISQDLSYFSGPRTSGAATIITELITNIIRSGLDLPDPY